MADRKKYEREWKRKARAKDREAKGRVKHARDSTRIVRLSENQIMNLYDQIDASEHQDHDLGEGWEEFTCHVDPLLRFAERKKKDGTLSSYGWYEPLNIRKRCARGPDDSDNPGILLEERFPAGAVILAVEGLFPANPGDQVSHLCDNSRCLRPEHLRWETQQQNSDRKNCPGWAQCACCDTMHDICKHEPKCIKATPRE
jgi:hypothetical protein